jgi:hypothetical protein
MAQSVALPPDRIVVLTTVAELPPEPEATRMPPLLTVVKDAVPPPNTAARPPLLTVRSCAEPPDR